MSMPKDNMRKLLIVAALAASTSAFSDCPADWHFSPQCVPDTSNNVPEPDTLALLLAGAVAGGMVRVIKRRKK